tara:strand:- start:374 stop:589 length:216 start_codon:yes stop_codon:yes gene_type:complete
MDNDLYAIQRDISDVSREVQNVRDYVDREIYATNSSQDEQSFQLDELYNSVKELRRICNNLSQRVEDLERG